MAVDRDQLRRYLNRVTVDLRKSRRRLRELEDREHEPIAIVGIGCRYPGGARSAEDLWTLVDGGVDCISAFPADRGWRLGALNDSDRVDTGVSYVHEGGFVHDATEFDAEFFGISPREALAMDPQQRLVLETSWEAFEHAGVDIHALRGSETGVFLGIGAFGYGLGPSHQMKGLLGHRATGSAFSVASGRVAYTFGFEGPAISIDTACSSSLMAMHLACQSLRRGECELALAGGVAVLSTPEVFVEFAENRGLARDGRCKSFANVADGTGWAEGVGVLLVERLSDAQRLGHRVLAVVRGSAVNQDGTSNGLTAPNGPSQQRVIQSALLDAGLTVEDVEAVEAHGTGTMLGDPIEAQALLATYGLRGMDRPLWLGSIKSNIGHTQAAAGVAGVIKMVMAMHHGVLPRTLHVDEPSREVDWSAGAVSLLTESVPWIDNGKPRRAGVSSFGMSGTNAHVIIEEAPVGVSPRATVSTAAIDGLGRDESDTDGDGFIDNQVPESVGVSSGEPVFLGERRDTDVLELVPWPVSGKGTAALRAQAQRLCEYIEGAGESGAADVGFSLACKPTFENRAVVLGRSREELLAGLRVLARGERTPDVVSKAIAGDEGAGVVWMFPDQADQGFQWAGMAADLLKCSPVFRRCILDCEDALSTHVDWSLENALCAGVGAPSLGRVDVVQPVLFAIMVSLAELWRACGVRPSAVVGNSQGEIAAAHIAGALSLQDAARVITARSAALADLAGMGCMASVVASRETVGQLIECYGSAISIAAINGPRSVVVSGEMKALDELLVKCEEEDVVARRITVDYAAHSSQVETVGEGLRAACLSISPMQGEIPFYSTVTGGRLDGLELDGGYWYRNLRETVELEKVIRALLDNDCDTFTEMSPQPVLAMAVQETAGRAAVVGSLDRGESGREAFLRAASDAWEHGVEVDWQRIFEPGLERLDLPRYAFQRERYWLSADWDLAGGIGAVGLSKAVHPLLGAVVSLADGEGVLFTGRLSLDTHGWLADHVVMGSVMLPGTAFLELALYVGAQVDCDLVQELTLEVPLVLSEGDAFAIQLSLDACDEAGRRRLAVYSRVDGDSIEGQILDQEWTCHATGLLAPDDNARRELRDGSDVVLNDTSWPPPNAVELPLDGLYERFAEMGIDYGPAFQGLQAVWRHGDELFAEVSLAEEQRNEAAGFGLHPALLDASLHTALANELTDEVDGVDDMLRLPFSWRDVNLDVTGKSVMRVHMWLTDDGSLSLRLADRYGKLVASVGSLIVHPVGREQINAATDGRNHSLFHVKWERVPVVDEGFAQPMALLGSLLAPSAGVKAANRSELVVYNDLAALLQVLDEGLAAPAIVVARCIVERDGRGTPASAARAGVKRVLALLQEWLADERLSDMKLVLVTEGAVTAGAQDDDPDPVAASVWGLVRSAQAEHPDRFVLVDLDRTETSWEALPGALGIDETQLALRAGEALVPRLVRAVSPRLVAMQTRGGLSDDNSRDPAGQAEHEGVRTGSPFGGLGPSDGVLITGGTGSLGGLVARHLVVEHNVRTLVLASRSGIAAPGAKELQEELTQLGANVTVAACDVREREELATLIDSMNEHTNLRAVIHAAGTLDDGVLDALTPERIDRAMVSKVDAAWHLHELTEGLDLAAFVLFSSAAGVFGAPGQANYAAANAFLDALAARRRAGGLPGVSIAWGLWSLPSGMAAHLEEADVRRIERLGLRTLQVERGLDLFDTVCEMMSGSGMVGVEEKASAQDGDVSGDAEVSSTDHATVIAAPLDLAVIRTQAGTIGIPGLLRSLVRMSPRHHSRLAGNSLVRRLDGLSMEERQRIVLELVAGETAAVLGHANAGAIEPVRAFKELGFDSLLAVELQNRLSTVTGLRLPATLIFDHPTPVLLAGHLLDEFAGTKRLNGLKRSIVTSSNEPIAIVGMACRYPGGVGSPEELWTLLASGNDAITGMPHDRGWDLDTLYDISYAREGGFMHDAIEFDPAFFGIGPSEAIAMDPQQRLILEICWEACEDAAIDPRSLRGSATGVFAGVMYQDYARGTHEHTPPSVTGYLGVGRAGSIVSGRVAYVLGLEGPAMTVDTACSSSLVTSHLACKALRAGECELALAGGVTVLSTPEVFVEFAQNRGLAPDGRCKSFADAADGTGWAEGVGVLLLERLSDAKRRGHRVLAVMSGSAVNQDGTSNGLTAPNGPSQRRVIQSALQDAGLSASEVDAVEAHGTGTTLGDPIEAQALLATYGAHERTHPLWLGSIKSNLGHTQAAAGVAGVIKMVMAMRHGMLPRTLHVDEPSRQVDWSVGSVSLLTESVPWESNGRPRRAGISSFGISGTNAHVIIEEAPRGDVSVPTVSPVKIDDVGDEGSVADDRNPTDGGMGLAGRNTHASEGVGEDIFVSDPGEEAESGIAIWPISGKGDAALRAQATRLFEYFDGRPRLNLADVGFSLTCKPAFEDRAIVLGRSREQLLMGLNSLAGGEASPDLVEGVAGTESDRVAWVFPGQGSQWAGMALELIKCSPVFRRCILDCHDALAPFVDWSLEDVLCVKVGAPTLERVDVVQPVLFATMVALAALWRACGVRPSAVVGHSQGEIAAAHVAGALSLQDAARVITARSSALVALTGLGGMVSVVASQEEVESLIECYDGAVSIAAINGPRSVVISGEDEVLIQFLSKCEDDNVRARRIAVDYAAHSPQVEAIGDGLRVACSGITPGQAEVPFYSAVTGGQVDGSMLSADYWYRNLRETVNFEQATRSLLADGLRAFVEVSPAPALTVGVAETADLMFGDEDKTESGEVRQSYSLSKVRILGSLRRDDGGPQRFMTSVAEAWVSGVGVSWERLYQDGSAKVISLPTYAFQRERFWLDTEQMGDVRAVGQARTGHMLLGAAVALPDEGWLFTGRVSLSEYPWLKDHRVLGEVLFPESAFLEFALYVCGELGCDGVHDLTLQRPLVLPEHDAVQVQVRVGEPDELSTRSFRVDSRVESFSQDVMAAGDGWICHATGSVGTVEIDSQKDRALLDIGTWPPTDAESVQVELLYDRLADIGLEYGPMFQGLTRGWRRDGEVFAEVVLPDIEVGRTGSFEVHPALLDVPLGAVAFVDQDESVEERGDVRLPFSWTDVRQLKRSSRELRLRLSAVGQEAGSLTAWDEHGRLVLSVGSLSTRDAFVSGSSERVGGRHEAMFGVDWVQAQVGAPLRLCALVSPDTNGEAIVAELSSAGVACPMFEDIAELASAVVADGDTPEAVLFDARVIAVDREAESTLHMSEPEDVPGAVRTGLQRILAVLREWLVDERLSTCLLVVITEGAVEVNSRESLHDLGGSAVWGLVRSAQAENPGRLALVDVDGKSSSWSVLGRVPVREEPQLVLRDGTIRVPRLSGMYTNGLLPSPHEGAWRLGVEREGTFDSLTLVPDPRATAPLGPTEVRIEMRAAGLNFHDVIVALGMYPGEADIGGEGAGVIVETGEEVRDLAVGDRVMGMMSGAMGTLALADSHRVTRVPEGWTFDQAASVPMAFVTAYYALVDLVGLRSGERLLVHAAAGGVGMAAVQIARHIGAEVFGTASPGKWDVLRSMGLPDAHIASSRTLGFEREFLEATAGKGVDVVLNSLAGKFVDASLGLLTDGGRFAELGKTDVRNPQEIASEYQHVAYRIVDHTDQAPERLSEILAELTRLFECGALNFLPTTTWNVRRAREAFRHMSQGHHIGKNVLRLPVGLDASGTVLITGGTGGLGGLVARHLVAEYGVRRLLLVSRHGLEANGASELVEELSQLGAQVSVAACDISERDQAERLFGDMSTEHGLAAVVHAAGVIDNGLISSLTHEQLDRVLAAKVGGAWNLHRLTSEMDLSAFVLFSSIAGLIGSPGQGNYAAANAFIDALAVRRRALGLAGTSIAWGLWARASGMAGQVAQSDLRQMSQVGLGALLNALPDEDGLALFDEALAVDEPLVVSARLDMDVLRARAKIGEMDALLRGLIHVRPRDRSGSSRISLARRLAETAQDLRESIVLELVCSEVALVLGQHDHDTVDPQRAFKDLGFDSLAGVELRNRLASQTGMSLPATIVFDYPTPEILARYILDELVGTVVNRSHKKSRVNVDEPVAIVGMGCRYPGGVSSPRHLWDLVRHGDDAISAFPADRGWESLLSWDSDHDNSGGRFVEEGGFLYDAAEFDASFFEIGPREALAMDPQQRLLLEVSWGALEDAGLDPRSLAGSDTGVFAGLVGEDYHRAAVEVPPDLAGYGITGSSASVVSGRIAYSFGFEGPAVTVESACSSSLVAMHLACQALRGGDCSLALAGGVTVLATPMVFVEFWRQGGLAVDGRCKSFSDSADGTGFAEGVGVLVLERLSDAERNGHRVLALVRGSAVNQDGASNGLTAPSGPSQQRVIERALTNADLDSGDVDVVEGHGTGTTLGDPIEAQALLATYGQGRDAGRPLWLGSVKSNIGHTQAAAGVAGVIKMVMALEQELLPRTLHVDRPSTHVDWDTGAVSLLTEEVPWKRADRPRRAGVSSFGLSGTNAHLIIEEPPASGAEDRFTGGPQGASAPLAVVPWLISADSERALIGQAERLHAYVTESRDVGLADIGVALSSRSRLRHRAVVWGGTRPALLDALRALADGHPAAQVLTGAATRRPGPIAFLFTGQGAQHGGMGSVLYQTFPVFRDALDESCGLLEAHLGRSLRELMFAARGSEQAFKLDETEVTQPALFALEVALFRLVESWGLHPNYVIGHSIGELVAAHVAGVLTLRDACALVAARGRLMGALPKGGAMAAVQATEEEILGSLEEFDGRVALAAVNGPVSVVLAGEEDAVLQLTERWDEQGRKTKRLRVSHAFHSHRMDGMLEQFAEVAAGVSFGEPHIPVVSNLTGAVVSAEELCSAGYWVRQARETVRFADGVHWLAEQGVSSFLELGPDGVLSAMVHQCLSGTSLVGATESSASNTVDDADANRLGEMGATVTAMPLLRADREGLTTLIAGLASVWVAGAEVDWTRLFDGSQTQRVRLPTYAFQRERFWFDSNVIASVDDRNAAMVERDGPFYLDWTAIPVDPAAASPRHDSQWVLIGPEQQTLDWKIGDAIGSLERYASLELLGEAIESGQHGVPDVVLLQYAALGGDLPTSAHAVTASVLGVLREWLDDRRIGDARLAILTRGAMSVEAGEDVSDPAAAAVWGLVGSAQSENPGRILLIDVDGEQRSWDMLAVALAGDEPKVAIRHGELRAPRLVETDAGSSLASKSLVRMSPHGTVLITGGTGGLGARLARHLVVDHGVQNLLLVSRAGETAPGAVKLQQELAELGASVRIASCDVADREQLQALIASIDAERPLCGVIHAAGVLDDGVIRSLTPERVDGVLGPKVDGAWYLHDLTRHIDLDAFVLFSSVAATLGAPGQGSYAAANAFLDALAAHRRARGLPAVSMAWGSWEQTAGMTSQLRRTDMTRIASSGMLALSAERGMELFDLALTVERSLVVLMRLDPAVLRASSGGGELPRVLAGLVPTELSDPVKNGPPSLVARLVGVSGGKRSQVVLESARAHTAAVLGFDSPGAVDSTRTFKELGFDSLAAVLLRNRLVAATGLQLSHTLVFDYPTLEALTGHLCDELAADTVQSAASLEMNLDALQLTLSSMSAVEAERSGIAKRLQSILSKWATADQATDADMQDEDLSSASDDDMFELIDRELEGA